MFNVLQQIDIRERQTSPAIIAARNHHRMAENLSAQF
jgi:hypothetical protein